MLLACGAEAEGESWEGWQGRQDAEAEAHGQKHGTSLESRGYANVVVAGGLHSHRQVSYGADVKIVHIKHDSGSCGASDAGVLG